MPKDDWSEGSGHTMSLEREASPFDASRVKSTVFGALLRARKENGGRQTAIMDADGRALSYDDLIRASLALGPRLTAGTTRGEAVAVLLPTGAASSVAFFAISAQGRVPAMLNFTAGERALMAALGLAPAKRVVTARKFVELGGYQGLVDKLSEVAEIVYLEDVRDSLSKREKLAAAAGAFAPALGPRQGSTKDLAVILYTSGTEGAPKGVALSHANLIANVEQIRQHIELHDDDLLFNPLPTFHCFGLTVGLLTPLYAGVPVAMHPSPLQAKTIAHRVAEVGATIIIATDTFLAQYARAGRDGDLKTVRMAVCGAERVRDETRALVKRKFDLDVLEGYGATEAAPVLAANQLGSIKPGTVGRLMPGVEARLSLDDGVPGGGRLFVRGPNVMMGYIKPDAPGVIQPTEGGWHDTGDIVAFDSDDCVAIRGRLKRFAKVGGEMVSLAVVENCASTLWPDHSHAAVALKDPRKGEQIVLVTEYEHADRGDLLAFAQNHGVPELAVPKRIEHVGEIPVLGTGKIDYPGVGRLIAPAGGAV